MLLFITEHQEKLFPHRGVTVKPEGNFGRQERFDLRHSDLVAEAHWAVASCPGISPWPAKQPSDSGLGFEQDGAADTADKEAKKAAKEKKKRRCW